MKFLLHNEKSGNKIYIEAVNILLHYVGGKMSEDNKGNKVNTSIALEYSFAECDEMLAKRIQELRKRTLVEIVFRMVKQQNNQGKEMLLCTSLS